MGYVKRWLGHVGLGHVGSGRGMTRQVKKAQSDKTRNCGLGSGNFLEKARQNTLILVKLDLGTKVPPYRTRGHVGLNRACAAFLKILVSANKKQAGLAWARFIQAKTQHDPTGPQPSLIVDLCYKHFFFLFCYEQFPPPSTNGLISVTSLHDYLDGQHPSQLRFFHTQNSIIWTCVRNS